MVTAGFPWCVPFTGQLAGLFRAYTARKRARNLLDFDDLLLFWQAALADPVAGPVLRGMFDAVLVDEYQDVNAVQASIVRLLQPDGKQLTCVGDDAQALAVCDSVTAAPLAPVLPPVGSLATKVDTALGALWDG